MSLTLTNPHGITVRQMKDYLNNVSDLDSEGDDRVFWVTTGENITNTIKQITPLNLEFNGQHDILLEWNEEWF